MSAQVHAKFFVGIVGVGQSLFCVNGEGLQQSLLHRIRRLTRLRYSGFQNAAMFAGEVFFMDGFSTSQRLEVSGDGLKGGGV